VGLPRLRLRLAGQLNKAIADHSKAIELDTKFARAWANRGVAFADLRQWNKAIGDYSKAIDLDPKLMLAWYNRGIAHANLGQWSKAIVDYTKAVELDPKHSPAWDNRGLAHADSGQLNEAIADHSKAVELDRKYTAAWINRGLAHELLGQWDKAIADLSKGIELEPNDHQWYNYLAKLLATRADPKFRDQRRAVELAKKAVELVPKKGAYWNTLGEAHYRAADWQAARAALEKSVELRKGGDSLDWYFLAMVHWKLDHKDEAGKIYNRAVQWMKANQPNDDDLRRLRAEAAKLLGIEDIEPKKGDMK
jgi:tetratricopeptide (TPR) repeat protein